ncbi:MAG: hypothetical protein WBA93_09000 [Microcoleaceae cyanobacterium]
MRFIDKSRESTYNIKREKIAIALRVDPADFTAYSRFIKYSSSSF